jgi:hypothetical protein
MTIIDFYFFIYFVTDREMHFRAFAILASTMVTGALAATPNVSSKGNLRFVDPRIGTDGETVSEYGGMIPSTGNYNYEIDFLLQPRTSCSRKLIVTSARD